MMSPLAARTAPTESRLRRARAMSPWFVVLFFAGLGVTYLVHAQWFEHDDAIHRLELHASSDALADVLDGRLSEAWRTVGAVERLLVSGSESEAAARAILDSGPEAVGAVAVYPHGGSDGPSVSGQVYTRASLPPGRMESKDCLAAVESALAAGTARTSLLDDGNLLLVQPLSAPDGTRAAAAALIERAKAFTDASPMSYRVLDGAGHVAWTHGGAQGLPPTWEGATRRRFGLHGWSVESVAPPPAAAWSRWWVTGGVGITVLLLLVWTAWQGRARREAHAAARVYRTLFEEAADLVLVLDDRLAVARASERAERTLGLIDDGDYGRPFEELFGAGDRPRIYDGLHRAQHGATSEFTAQPLSCLQKTYRFRCVPLLLDHSLEGVQVLAEDVTEQLRLQSELDERQRELEELNERLFRASITDPLTGVNNRRHLAERAEQEVDRAQRYGRDLACLFLDLDHFKKINDTFGHATGDTVLKVFAERLQVCVRRSDLIGRYGGEEFVVSLTDTSPGGAMVTARKILDLTRTTRFEGLPPGWNVELNAPC